MQGAVFVIIIVFALELGKLALFPIEPVLCGTSAGNHRYEELMIMVVIQTLESGILKLLLCRLAPRNGILSILQYVHYRG